jgi:hypothetical protein
MILLTIRRLKPEEKVNLAINMTDVCVRICADALKNEYPGIGEKELIKQVRKRLTFGRRHGREA